MSPLKKTGFLPDLITETGFLAYAALFSVEPEYKSGVCKHHHTGF
jgi:hypothetical protein